MGQVPLVKLLTNETALIALEVWQDSLRDRLFGSQGETERESRGIHSRASDFVTFFINQTSAYQTTDLDSSSGCYLVPFQGRAFTTDTYDAMLDPFVDSLGMIEDVNE